MTERTRTILTFDLMANLRVPDAANTVLVIVDMQEAFRSAIGDWALITSNIATAVRGFRLLEIPIIVTEQYPKGLGRTVEELLLTLPDDLEVIEKSTFSSASSDLFNDKIRELDRKQIVLCGIETHVCVNQTAHELLEQGFSVHLLLDCVGSRYEHDKEAGIKKMLSSGVVPSSFEMALFELMRDSKHSKFKEIQALVK